MTFRLAHCRAIPVLILIALVSAPLQSADAASNFPIADSSGREKSVSVAFDGRNFLVAIQGDAANDQEITAQLVSPTGALVGPLIDTNKTGGAPKVAFDGTNYLMVWECSSQLATCIAGQFVSTSGALVGAPFTIALGTKLLLGLPGIVFDGSNYFVVWRNIKTVTKASDIVGQFVTPKGGNLGSPLTLYQAGTGAFQPPVGVAFDGTNILAVWADARNQKACFLDASSTQICYETDLYGQFIAKSSATTPGAPSGGNFPIDEGLLQLDSAGGIGFDGKNYLLTYVAAASNPCSACGWDGYGNVYGILLSKSGVPIAPKFAIGDASATKRFPMADFLGNKYIVTWTDTTVPLAPTTEARFVTTSGAIEGPELTLFSTAASGNAPWMTRVLTARGVTLAITDWGIPDPTNPAKFDLYGADVAGSILSLASDTTPPTVPTGVTATASNSKQVNLDWTPSTDDFAVTSYDVYRDGTLIASPAEAAYSDTGLTPSTLYSYTVDACDAAGNCSAQSASATATTPASIITLDPNAALPIAQTLQALFALPQGRLPTTGISVAIGQNATFRHATVKITLDLSQFFPRASLAGEGQFADGYNIYVAALVPAGTQNLPVDTWFMLVPGNSSSNDQWTTLSFPIAAYLQGVAPDATQSVEIDILSDLDVTGLGGAEIYIGYGTSDTEMLDAGRYRGVYKIE